MQSYLTTKSIYESFKQDKHKQINKLRKYCRKEKQLTKANLESLN